MSENDFRDIQNDEYRGSSYSNFVGSGVDPQGNVSSSLIENVNNTTTPYSGFSQTPAVADSLSSMQNEMSSVVPYNSENISSSGGAGSINSIAAKALPSIGSAAGSEIARNIASGAENIFSNVGTSAISKISGGLISPAAGSAAQMASLTSSLSGAGSNTAAGALSKITSKATGSLGGAVGTGLGSAAATLLTGGSFGEAAKSGAISTVGYVIGNAILPGVGGFIGSTLASLVGGFFGGGLQRQTSGAGFSPNESGRYTVSDTTGKNVGKSDQRRYADRVATVLNGVADQFGIKFTGGVRVGSNVGKKDPVTILNGKRVSNKPYDMDKVSLSLLQDESRYTFGDNGDSVIQSRIPEFARSSSSLKDLGQKLDEFNVSRGLVGGNLPYLKQKNKYSFGV